MPTDKYTHTILQREKKKDFWIIVSIRSSCAVLSPSKNMSHANIPRHCFCPLTQITLIIVMAKQHRNKKRPNIRCLYGLFYHEEPLDAV